MITRNTLVVFRKELKDALRDRRALKMLLLFVFLYPLTLWGTLNRTIHRATRADAETNNVLVLGAAAVPNLVRRLEEQNVTVSTETNAKESQITEWLKKKRYSVVIKIESQQFRRDYFDLRPAQLQLWYDSAAEEDAKVRRVQAILRVYNAQIAHARLMARGVSSALVTPIQLQEYDTATGATRSGRFIGALLGAFFVAAFYFCFNTAVDTTAGERERRSLETLLAQPASALDIITGKWLAAGLLSLAGLIVELSAGNAILRMLPLEEAGLSWRVGSGALLIILLVSVPLCFFAAALQIAVAMNSKTFKEAQTTVSFLLLIPLIPVFIVPMFGLGTKLWMYTIPGLAHQTLLLELARGQIIGPLPFLITAGVPIAAAALCVSFAARRIQSERFVLGV